MSKISDIIDRLVTEDNGIITTSIFTDLQSLLSNNDVIDAQLSNAEYNSNMILACVNSCAVSCQSSCNDGCSSCTGGCSGGCTSCKDGCSYGCGDSCHINCYMDCDIGCSGP